MLCSRQLPRPVFRFDRNISDAGYRGTADIRRRACTTDVISAISAVPTTALDADAGNILKKMTWFSFLSL